MESVLLILVCLTPWAYGAVHPGFEFLLDAGVALLVGLWGVQIMVQGQFTWNKCPVAIGLASLFLLGICQIVPLNKTLLAYLSPAGAALYGQLLPSQHESVSFDEPYVRISEGSTVSLYPEATRLRLHRILVVFLVFAVVRSNFASTTSLRRFAIVALLNGAALSLFALLQFFSSPPRWLYWRFPSSGGVFGPFICKNHFSFYVNICIGLGLGLLWSRRFALPDTQLEALPFRHATQKSIGLLALKWLTDRCQLAINLLRDPATLGICAVLALMVSSSLFSLSRGGFLALVGGFIVWLIVQMTRSTGFLRPGVVFLSAACAAGLLGWFGFAHLQTRLATLLEGTALQESRLPLWLSAYGIGRDFPVWGSGYGTYQYMNSAYSKDTEFADYNVDHAHNDYLEMWAEGGFAGLFLVLVTIATVFRLGYRAVHNRHQAAPLLLGALFAFTTVVLHSFGDFGIHVPAIALLATVTCAHLCAAGSPNGTEHPHRVAQKGTLSNGFTLRLRGLASLTAALTCFALGLIIFGAGWRLYRVEGLRLAALRTDGKADASRLEDKAKYLHEAVRISPGDAELMNELGEAYSDLFELHAKVLILRAKVLGVADTILNLLAFEPAWCLSCRFAALPMIEVTAAIRERQVRAETKWLQHKYLVPALTNFLQAHDRGPLLPGPHLNLARHAEQMIPATTAVIYRNRVKLLAPADPTLWYYCGDQELRQAQFEYAWKSWRHCLKLSTRYQGLILERSAAVLSTESLVRELIPADPNLLLKIAWGLYPRPEATAQREPFLRRAITLVGIAPATLQDVRIKARTS